jgi:uncharacterized Zn finger protein (UPF0148 family)
MTDKPCDRCGVKPRVHTEKYCPNCKFAVLRQLAKEGYLEELKEIRRSWNKGMRDRKCLPMHADLRTHDEKDFDDDELDAT